MATTSSNRIKSRPRARPVSSFFTENAECRPCFAQKERNPTSRLSRLRLRLYSQKILNSISNPDVNSGESVVLVDVPNYNSGLHRQKCVLNSGRISKYRSRMVDRHALKRGTDKEDSREEW